MTVTREEPRANPALPSAESVDGDPRDPGPDGGRVVATVRAICPYLGAGEGAWRAAHAAREHRCSAVEPPAPLAIAKQRSLCLVPVHRDCATYLAARELARVREGPVPDVPWGMARTTPVILELARAHLVPLPAASVRTGSQALVVGLMVLAFVVLVVARTTAPIAEGGATPSASAGTASVPAVLPGGSASATPRATPSSSPSATTAPSGTPAATPVRTPAPARSYTVKGGDSLSSIAAQFGTTVRALVKANGLADKRLIKPGQVLLIP